MKKNLSTNQLSASALTAKSLNTPQNTKKIQGYDKATTAQSFATKIQKIKNRPKKESLQDQYVKGLQDEIHYLQLELKLLKEKQIVKHSQVDQLETFFGDGIEINQNILALKNGFSNYKTLAQKKAASLSSEKKQRQFIIQSMQAKVVDLSKQIGSNEKKYKQSLEQKSSKIQERVKKQKFLKQVIQTQDVNLKSLKIQNKRMSESILGLQRAKQLIFVALLKTQANKFNKLNKLRQSVAQKQKQLELVGNKYQELKKQDDEKTFVTTLVDDNKKLRKKIISMESQLAELRRKGNQKQMELQDKLQQRHNQILARMQMQQRLDSTKKQIERESNMSVQQLQKFALQRSVKILQKVIDKNKKISKYVQYYRSLLSKIDENVYQLSQKKPDLKDKILYIQNQVKRLQRELQSQKNIRYEFNSQIARLQQKNTHIQQFTPPASEQIKKMHQKIKSGEKQKEDILNQIRLKQKQLELIQILKGLNLEQTEISRSSNVSIRDHINNFINSWDNIHANN